MKTCARCGRTYPADQTVCSQCGLSLPGMRGLAGAVSSGAASSGADPTVAHMDFLLGQLDEWVRSGWVAPEQARRLWDIYQDRRRRLVPEPCPEAGPAATLSPVAPSAPPDSISISPPPVRRVSPLAAFFEERNLSFWQLLGALLLLAGLVGLVRWTWGSVGKYLVLALMLGLTGGLFALARSRVVRGEPLTRSALTAIAALLVPLDMIAVNAFHLLGGALETQGIGLLTSLLCLPLYAWIARREPGRWPAGTLAANAAAALYFALHALLPPSAAPEVRGIAYGLTYSGLSLAALLAARRAGEARRSVWLSTAHVAALSSLAFALWLGGPDAVGSVAAALLLLSLAYGLAAGLFDDRNFVVVAQSVLTLGGALVLHRLGLGGWLERWYGYVVWGQAVGFASWVFGQRLERQGRAVLANACRQGGLALAGLAVIAQTVRLTVALTDFPALALPLLDLGGLLLPAALSFGFFAFVRRGTLAASLLVYLITLTDLLLSRLMPVHSVWRDQPNLALPLAAAALLLWRLNRPRVSLAAAALGLLLCAVYAALSVFWITTVLALPLLVLLFAVREKTARRVSVWSIAGASVLEVLLLQQRLLPWTQTHWGWEPNYGLGLAALSLAGLLLSDRKQSRDWLRAGLAVAAGDVLLQLGYAGAGQLAYSPLLLLGLGAFVSGGIGLARKLPRAADCAAGLLGCFYLAFLFGMFSAPTAASPLQELLTAAGLTALSLLMAWLSVRQRRPLFVYPSVLAAALGEAHGLHRIWHPAPVVYALAFWPLTAALYAIGIWPARRLGTIWQMPLLTSATAVSLLILLGAAAGTLLRSPAGGTAGLIEAVCLYGGLYAAAGLALQGPAYAGLAAAAFSGALWLALLRLTPPLSMPQHAFQLSLGGLGWLAVSFGAGRVSRARFAARPLNGAAIGVGLAAVLIALAGRNGTDDRFIVYTLLIAGTAFIGASRGLSLPGWGHAGVAAYFFAYFAFLVKRLGLPGVPNSDFYLIPAGLYVLALGLLTRREAKANSPAYFLAGLLLTMTPTFAATWPPQSAPLHAVLLLTECVVAVFYGIAARVKVFVGAGVAFLVALLLRETHGLVGHIHWAVYATALGLAILASALFFEKRGAEVRRWAQTARTKLGEWD